MTAVILSPHKSIDKICEEYSVEFSNEDIKKLSDLAYNYYRDGSDENYGKLAGELRKIGSRHGLKGERLDKFVKDTVRTFMFYCLLVDIIT